MRINKTKFMEYYNKVVIENDIDKIEVGDKILDRLLKMEVKYDRQFPDVELTVDEFKILYKEKF